MFSLLFGTLTIVSLTTIFSIICQAQQQCDPGWFGLDCQFKCHCAGDIGCSVSDGSCSSGCDPAWFGPACQYDVSEFAVDGGSELTWLTDNDDKTCNGGTDHNITVTLETSHFLSWIRVVVNDPEYLNQFQLSYQRKDTETFTTCLDARSAKVDNKTLDISCPTSDIVRRLTLSGNIVRDLCLLVISGGRNVALKQEANQSSTQHPWFAENAVDGEIDTPDDEDSQSATCSHTVQSIEYGWWTLMFSNNVEINRFLIYNRRNPNREDCCEDRLVGFVLRAAPSVNTNIFLSYTDPGGPAQDVYTVVPFPKFCLPVKSVRIDLGRDLSNNRIMTLCEVVIFGEVVCPSGKFGFLCERDCNCVDGDACFVSTGGCPTGCAPGFTGVDCATPCENGKYGSGCTETCSENCAGSARSCNRRDGSCEQGCEPGYQAPVCKEILPQADESGGSDQNDSAIIGGVVAAVAVVVVVLVIVAVFLYRRWKLSSQESDVADDEAIKSEADLPPPPGPPAGLPVAGESDLTPNYYDKLSVTKQDSAGGHTYETGFDHYEVPTSLMEGSGACKDDVPSPDSVVASDPTNYQNGQSSGAHNDISNNKAYVNMDK